MAKALSFSPFQIASPVQLLFCLVLFFLPWVEVQCSLPPSMVKEMPKEMVEAAKKESGIDPTKSLSMFSQSGWQIASGDISPGSDLKKMMDKEKGKGGGKKSGGGEPGPAGGPDLGPDPDAMNKKMKEDSGTAPLLYLYPVALLGGIVCGLLPIMPMVRRILTAGCCAAAFGVVALQCLIGFPIENELKKQNDEAKQQISAMGKMAGPAPKGNPKDAKADKGKTDSKGDADIFRTSYQFALYLTFLLLVTAGATAFLDALAGGGGKSAKRKKSRYADGDDEEEEEEEDRPRKKKRDEEEDDERARKKKRRDEEEDEDRPRKRRRDEDEEEEDRPRKKKAVSRDEDEEDDRPRKRRRDEEEQEEEAPRKKPQSAAFEVVDEPPALPPPPAPKPAAQRPATPPPPAAPAAAGDNPFAFDEGESKPKKKPRPRDEDDEDDRPRKKRRRDDD